LTTARLGRHNEEGGTMKRNLYLRPTEDSFTRTYVDPGYYPKLFLGGFAATLTMTLMVYLAPLIGIPNVDFAGLLGSLLVGRAPGIFTGPWWLGMAWHFMNGSVFFPLLYAHFVYPVFSGTVSGISITEGFSDRPMVRATLYSLILWAFCQGLAMPLVGGGFFSSQTMQPFMVVVGSMIAHLIYGSVLGGMTTARATHVLEYRQNQAA